MIHLTIDSNEAMRPRADLIREAVQKDDCPLVSQQEEKEFEIGQRVRIVGPTVDGHAVYIGKCFFIDRIIGPPHQQQKEYSRMDCGCIFPASSLEPVERDPDRLEAIERRLDSIEKRLQQMGQAGKA